MSELIEKLARIEIKLEDMEWQIGDFVTRITRMEFEMGVLKAELAGKEGLVGDDEC